MNTITAQGCVDTGIRDSKGRMIGCVWSVKTIDGWARKVGKLDGPTQVVECCAARDGRHYGASFQAEVPCANLDEAFIEIVRRSTTVLKSAERRFASRLQVTVPR
jgi:hypothetical protein